MICSIVLSSDINRCIHNGNFPNNLKNADITPTFKKGDRLSKCSSSSNNLFKVEGKNRYMF